MSRTRIATAIVSGCAIAVSISACGGTAVQGDPSPGSHSPSSPANHGTPTTSPSGTSSTSSAVHTLEQTNPCALLTKQELTALKITVDGKTSNSVTSRGCEWGQTPVVILVSIRAHQGIDTFPLSKKKGGGAVTKLDINGRQAVMQKELPVGCTISLRVANTARVDVGVTLNDDSKSCAGAKQIATIVERHLPPAQ